MSLNVLVVGGAGFIGSHCLRVLKAAGHRTVVLDSLVFGHRAAVPADVPFHQFDLGDEARLAKLFAEEKIDVVMHFAAFAYVGESVHDPLKYYFNNTVATLHLLRAMLKANVKKFVFSSTCASFGIPKELPIHEGTPQNPISPYGQTKLDVENALKALAYAHGLSFAVFRYFNAAGASEDGTIGEDHNPETHLIPVTIAAATGNGAPLQIYGTDYPTPDGTCLRDYVHVEDLARAHVAAFEKLEAPGSMNFFNLGTGKPSSVKEVIAAVEKASGLKVPYSEAPRRAGDPPALYADASKAKRELGWEVRYDTIDKIVATAWNWHKTHPKGFDDR